MRKVTVALALLLSVLSLAPARAEPTEEQTAAAAEAERRGLQMYAYDQAASHATKQFREEVAKAGGIEALRERGLRGYVVEPEGEAWRVVFYGAKDDRTFALASYAVRDSKVTGGGLIDAGAADELSPLAVRMVAALGKVEGEMKKPGHQVCTPSPPNSLIVPREDGGLSVYILTSTTDPEIYPAGGHYRFDFDAEGALTGERAFTTGCFSIDFKKVPKGDKPPLMVLSHLLDPQPTEIHSFVSQNIPFGIAVLTTANRQLWLAANGKLKYVRDAKPDEFKDDPAPEPAKDAAPAKPRKGPPLPPPQELPEGR